MFFSNFFQLILYLLPFRRCLFLFLEEGIIFFFSFCFTKNVLLFPFSLYPHPNLTFVWLDYVRERERVLHSMTKKRDYVKYSIALRENTWEILPRIIVRGRARISIKKTSTMSPGNFKPIVITVNPKPMTIYLKRLPFWGHSFHKLKRNIKNDRPSTKYVRCANIYL
jgi:hypothetical protein